MERQAENNANLNNFIIKVWIFPKKFHLWKLIPGRFRCKSNLARASETTNRIRNVKEAEMKLNKEKLLNFMYFFVHLIYVVAWCWRGNIVKW